MQTDRIDNAYERRIRIASEVATWGMAAVLVASAALPTTDQLSRLGLLLSAGLLAAFAILWFHVIPPVTFGPQRFTLGTAVTQIIASALLVLTGGSESRYFVFFLLPTLATTFAMRVTSTLAVGAIAFLTYLAILASGDIVSLAGGVYEPPSIEVLEAGVIRVFALVALIAMTSLITRTMQETRHMLRNRSDELAEQNRELEVSHSTALAVARARDLGELLRAAHESARASIATKRLFYFASDEHSGWTVAADGSVDGFTPDPTVRESPRQRALAEARTIAVSDTSADPTLAGTRSQLEVVSGVFVPLRHRGDVIGLVVFSDEVKREWTKREIRLAETVAESIEAAIASYTALEDVREQRETLAGRMKVLEGMNQLVESLALATDEKSTAQVASRAVAQSFRLLSATALFVDPSVALLEPVGSAGAARIHPVVNGPTSCPAIRSTRVFHVTSANDAVICPHMPFVEGSSGYTCVPLMAGGDSMGALFMEPTVGSVLEDTFVRAAADRVALSLANRRVLETAQRQATTDGLTGLHNRHFLAVQLRVMQSLAERHGEPYCAIAFDVDGLKQVNDTFGHEMGDLALRGFANTLKKTLRTSDLSFRTGGDEFLVIIPKARLDEARQAADRVRDSVAAQGRAEPHTAITVSAGVATWLLGRTAEQVLETADGMLYAAKRAGKDRVMVETLAGSAPTPS